MAKTGDVVIVRYYDHVLYHDAADLASMKPIIRETLGWLEAQDSDFIRLVWERYAEPYLSEQSRIRATGLAVRKCDIIEVITIE